MRHAPPPAHHPARPSGEDEDKGGRVSVCRQRRESRGPPGRDSDPRAAAVTTPALARLATRPRPHPGPAGGGRPAVAEPGGGPGVRRRLRTCRRISRGRPAAPTARAHAPVVLRLQERRRRRPGRRQRQHRRWSRRVVLGPAAAATTTTANRANQPMGAAS